MKSIAGGTGLDPRHGNKNGIVPPFPPTSRILHLLINSLAIVGSEAAVLGAYFSKLNQILVLSEARMSLSQVKVEVKSINSQRWSEVAFKRSTTDYLYK
jgi:hypothetical protein